MQIRYTGAEPRDLTFPGGTIRFEPGQKRDIEQDLAEAHIPLHHLEIVARGLAGQPDWHVTGTTGRPADSAGKAAWVTYAEELGWDEADAKALNKQQLIDQIDGITSEPAGAPGQE